MAVGCRPLVWNWKTDTVTDPWKTDRLKNLRPSPVGSEVAQCRESMRALVYPPLQGTRDQTTPIIEEQEQVQFALIHRRCLLIVFDNCPEGDMAKTIEVDTCQLVVSVRHVLVRTYPFVAGIRLEDDGVVLGDLPEEALRCRRPVGLACDRHVARERLSVFSRDENGDS